MRHKKMVAMLLAGGQGSRLAALTRRMAKPAVPFGGKYRIIDFPLSNCANSDIDTVGVLTQYEPMELNSYIGTGQAWDLDRLEGGVYVLPPHIKGAGGRWYSGTANAVYQNLPFIDQYDPEHVLILSGDHIYKMNYARMLAFHEANGADATIAVLTVPPDEAGRYGIMDTDAEGRITDFEEKPLLPKSNKASMGIYIFSWPILRDYLRADERDPASEHDFGKNVIPALLRDGKRLMAYDFTGYWRDVGTIKSLWEANMDLLEEKPELDLHDPDWRIYGRSPVMPPHYCAATAAVTASALAEGANVAGRVRHSVIFSGVTVEEDAEVTDSVVMPNARICAGARIHRAIVGEDAVVGEGAFVGAEPEAADGGYDTSYTGDITLIGNGASVPDNGRVPRGMIVARANGGFIK